MLRLFIVGCPRSGTTLLQTVLLSTDSIVSFPESHFFEELSTCPRRIPPGIYGKKILERWLDSAKMEYRKKLWTGFSRASSIEYFWKTLDNIAMTQSAKGWLEKTPGHVRYIDLIQKNIPDAKFIHIIRSYKDNIASLYLARQQWGDSRTALTTARDWFGHLSKSLYYLNHKNHCHISYEELVNQPGRVIEKLSSFTNLNIPEPETVDLSRYAKKIIEKNAVWKSNNLQSFKITAAQSKYTDAFNPEEKKEIEDYIKTVSRWLTTVTNCN